MKHHPAHPLRARPPAREIGRGWPTILQNRQSEADGGKNGIRPPRWYSPLTIDLPPISNPVPFLFSARNILRP